MSVKRTTKSVKAVRDLFDQRDSALSVVDLVHTFNGSMNKTTVYRILDRLEKEGILHSFLGKEGLKWYAKCKGCTGSGHSDSHPHFQCSKCGKMECLPSDLSIPSLANYKVETAELMLTGECERCLEA